MRYDECVMYSYAFADGRDCAGARAYHYRGRVTGNQYTYCEAHKPRKLRLLERITHRTD